MPGQRYNNAWARSCCDGCVVILAERRPCAGRVKRAMWRSLLSASGRPRLGNRLPSGRSLEHWRTCGRASMGRFWIPCELMRGQERCPCRSQERQGSHPVRIVLTAWSCGKSSRECCRASERSAWPTCSITATSSPERLCATVKRSGQMSRGSTVCAATSWSASCAMRTSCVRAVGRQSQLQGRSRGRS
jgi:hypothetical protein